MTITDYEVKPQMCPQCARVLANAMSTQDDRAPEPSDLTVCAHCLAFLHFDDSLAVRLLSDSELAALPRETRGKLYQVREACSAFNAVHGDWDDDDKGSIQ